MTGAAKSSVASHRARMARRFQRERLGAAEPADLKALIAAVPLDGVDLGRNRDTGRDVELHTSGSTPT